MLSAVAGVRTIRGDASALGHFFVELASGQRYLDANIDGDHKLAMIVPNDIVAYVRTDTREAKLPATGDVAIDKLVFHERAVERRGSIAATYQSALFASTYGPAYYRGYVDSVGAIGVVIPQVAATVAADTAMRTTGDRRIAYPAVAVAAAGAIASVTFGVLASRARSDFQATELQREAHDAKLRYDRDRAIAITSGAVAVTATAVAWWLGRARMSWSRLPRERMGISSRLAPAGEKSRADGSRHVGSHVPIRISRCWRHQTPGIGYGREA